MCSVYIQTRLSELLYFYVILLYLAYGFTFWCSICPSRCVLKIYLSIYLYDIVWAIILIGSFPHRISCECLCKATVAGLSVVLFVAEMTLKITVYH